MHASHAARSSQPRLLTHPHACCRHPAVRCLVCCCSCMHLCKTLRQRPAARARAKCLHHNKPRSAHFPAPQPFLNTSSSCGQPMSACRKSAPSTARLNATARWARLLPRRAGCTRLSAALIKTAPQCRQATTQMAPAACSLLPSRLASTQIGPLEPAGSPGGPWRQQVLLAARSSDAGEQVRRAVSAAAAARRAHPCGSPTAAARTAGTAAPAAGARPARAAAACLRRRQRRRRGRGCLARRRRCCVRAVGAAAAAVARHAAAAAWQQQPAGQRRRGHTRQPARYACCGWVHAASACMRDRSCCSG